MKNTMHLDIECNFDPNPGGNPLCVFSVHTVSGAAVWHWDMSEKEWVLEPAGAKNIIPAELVVQFSLVS